MKADGLFPALGSMNSDLLLQSQKHFGLPWYKEIIKLDHALVFLTCENQCVELLPSHKLQPENVMTRRVRL